MITDTDKIKIHIALHNKEAKEVEVSGVKFPIEIHSNSCRFVTVEHIEPIKWPLSFDEQARKTKTAIKTVFMEQNSSKPTKWGKMAREGHEVTWDVTSWNTVIVDGKIVKQ